ncbi:putative bifunctional diguanylate cyclase/phosphodiesterase [Oceanisphaera avium]|uniref:GGDEF domain-containing protein n=1 Tax=Oceanisphaera avium TaxID=1903694 RepID=A0A1Y0CVC1_9GAMM|nr:bifunctional diguanylate cyclase/phosphodiesterase [Oceanisphaera avium]ART79252.1 GGDEF domain-containing protein [Oceanisphaera avium]
MKSVISLDEHQAPRALALDDPPLSAVTELSFNTQLLEHLLRHSVESVMITNASTNKIERVNQAFTDITGYLAEEVMGETPSIVQSSRHGREFYEQMWHQLAQTGSWSGQVWNRRKSGAVYLQWLTINTLTNPQGEVTHRVAIGHDLTGSSIDRNGHNLFTFNDALTQLGNRQLLTSRLDQALAEAERTGIDIGLMVLDIGRFRRINEQLGLTWGDDILRQQARTLQAVVDQADTLVRLQGDMFAILRHNRAQDSSLAHLADKLISIMAKPIVLADQSVVSLQPSIGIAVYPRDALDNAGLLQAAEHAHAMAKRAGRSRFQFVDQRLHDLHHRELLIEHSLHHVFNTLHGEGLSLAYQPQVRPSDGKVMALEALLRWQHPQLGALSPAEFIPVAEQSAQSVRLDRWVIEQACQQIARWQHHYQAVPVVSVNLSAQQFSEPDFADWLLACVKRAGISADKLKLEVTETTMMVHKQTCIKMLIRLRALGFSISLDDFGTGYSALACLHLYPLDELKIDRSFMVEASQNTRAFLLLKTIVGLVQELGLQLVVEGVEQQAQLDLLADFGSLTVQGYFYYRPLSVLELEPILALGASA